MDLEKQKRLNATMAQINKRFGAGTENDYWEVTDKSGTKRIYEQNASSCVGTGKETFKAHFYTVGSLCFGCIKHCDLYYMYIYRRIVV